MEDRQQGHPTAAVPAHTMRTLPLLLLAAILGGCATQPAKPARKTPPPPPMPSGLKFQKSSVAVPRALFVPAAVSTGTNVYILGYHVIPPDPPFPAYTNAFIAADQPTGNTISIRMNTVATGDPVTWQEPAQFPDCVTNDTLVAVSISVTDQANHYFRSILTPCSVAAFAPAAAETRTATTNIVFVRNRPYRVISLKRAGENTNRVRRFLLVPK